MGRRRVAALIRLTIVNFPIEQGPQDVRYSRHEQRQ
jgi:hypothetical protein